MANRLPELSIFILPEGSAHYKALVVGAPLCLAGGVAVGNVAIYLGHSKETLAETQKPGAWPGF